MAGFRDVMGVLRRQGLAGFPPSVATDAHLGFSVMAYQKAEALFGRCEGQGSILARLVGTCARAPRGSKKEDIAQRAKVGYCSSCTRLTHVALPSLYTAVAYSNHKAHGIQLWRGHGPWAVRFFAAALYSRDKGSLSSV